MEKVHGIYPSGLNVKRLEDCTQLELFLYNYLLFYHIDMLEKKDINNKALEEYYYALSYVKYLSKRFGVEIELGTNKEIVITTISYLSWYNWCKKHFSSYSKEVLQKIYESIKNNEDISKYEIPVWNKESCYCSLEPVKGIDSPGLSLMLF